MQTMQIMLSLMKKIVFIFLTPQYFVCMWVDCVCVCVCVSIHGFKAASPVMFSDIFIFDKMNIYLEFSQGINIEEGEEINIHFNHTR